MAMPETVVGRRLRQRPIPWGTILRWLPRAPRLVRLCLRLLGDARVPWDPKLLLAAAVAYLLSPVDLLPELAFWLFGVADDLVLLWLALRYLLLRTPAPVLAEHLAAVGLARP